MSYLPQTLPPERRIARARLSMMRSPDFALYGSILALGRVTIDTSVPTACTDGRDEWYNPAFINTLSDPELAFVVLHEAGHKMYRHLFLWQSLYDRNRKLANMACDYVINGPLVDLARRTGGAVIRRPVGKDGKPMGLYDARFAGMSPKEVFEILLKEQGAEPQKQKQPGTDGSGDGDDGDGDDGASQDGNDTGNSGSRSQPDGGLDSHDWEGARELSEDEATELARDVDSAIRQGIVAAKKHGQGSSDAVRDIEAALRDKVDWRAVAIEFVRSSCVGHDKSSWRRINRRMLHTGVYMPSLISERIESVLIAVDTSGSIGAAELARAMGGLQGIMEQLRPRSLELFYWDTAVVGHETYSDVSYEQLSASTRPKGGGGTNPQCIVDGMRGRLTTAPECVIVLTDGAVPSWGTGWEVPVLWGVIGNPGATATVGKTVHIDD